jgi:uncharacterized protein YcgI (DUF1989 family)
LSTVIFSEIVKAGSGTSGLIHTGETLRLTDLEGQQVGVLASTLQADPTESLDCINSHWANGRYKWRVGDTLFSNRLNPMWQVSDDPTGNHHTGGGCCCNRAMIQMCGKDVDGCRETLEKQFSALGIDPSLFQAGSTIATFMSVTYTPEGDWIVSEPISKPGDYVEFTALTDLNLAVSVCGMPTVINASRPTPMRIEILSA